MSEVKTFRGLSLAEVEAKVRAELGDDAVIVRQREGLTGGVGGFFQRRVFEVEATSPAAKSLASSAAPNSAPQPRAPMPMPTPTRAPAVPEDFAAQLRGALAPELAQ